ncbi:DUF4232 domain-containing protein [Streptomyces sp. NPDC058953]|uniref:DUF4232 domain-containing protein n=1 Tax=unclassified Streptomyces TaxID=2593676 RepID=UPI0036C6722F
MRHTPLPLAAVLAGVLLLTACGDDKAPPGGASESKKADPCRNTAPAAGAADPAGHGVRITATTHFAPVPEYCDARTATAEFEISNNKREPYAYTVTFAVTEPSGRSNAMTPVTVDSVPAGGTVRRTFTTYDVPPSARGKAQVKIAEVRSVPVDEVGAPPGGCPESGVRVTVDEGEAAMGLRVVGVTLTNCGTRPYALDGYPRPTLLDEKHRAVDGVRILRGGAGIATGTGLDDPPRPVDLKPGESARTSLIWRNTHTGFGEAVNAPYVRLVPKPGASPVTVIPELDLGTTGKLGVGAWRKADLS